MPAAAVPAATVARLPRTRPWPGRGRPGCRLLQRAAGGAGEVARGGAAQQQRRDDRREVGVDLGELEVHRGALAALVQVRLDLAAVPLRQPLADVGAQVLVDPAALGLGGVGEVGGQEGLPQTLAGPVGQRGDGVRAHARAAARCRRASGPRPRGATAPAASARAGRRRPSRRRRTRTRPRRCPGRAPPGRTADMSSVVVSRDWAADPVDVQPAYGGEQVGAEGDVGTAAALQDRHHLGEGVRDQVVGVGAAHQLAGQPAGRVDVTLEELPVGIQVSAADARDQLRVAGSVDAGEEFSHVEDVTHESGICDGATGKVLPSSPPYRRGYLARGETIGPEKSPNPPSNSRHGAPCSAVPQV